MSKTPHPEKVYAGELISFSKIPSKDPTGNPRMFGEITLKVSAEMEVEPGYYILYKENANE